MGIHRGDFESASLTSQAPAAVQHATSRPDIGAGLKALAPGLRRWGDVMGKLSDMGDSYTMRKNKAEAGMSEANEELRNAKKNRIAAQRAVDDIDAQLKTASDADRKDLLKQQEIARNNLEARTDDEKKATRKSMYAVDVWNRTGFFGSVGTPSADTYEASNGIHWFTQMFKPPIRVEDNMKQGGSL